MSLLPGGREEIIDRFFLGGDNLRGFETGGAGPHDLVTDTPLGGRFIWTQSTELRFPLPVSPDLGLSGRAFVDVGSLTAGIVSRAPPPARRRQSRGARSRPPATPARRRRCRHLLAYRVRSDKR